MARLLLLVAIVAALCAVAQCAAPMAAPMAMPMGKCILTPEMVEPGSIPMCDKIKTCHECAIKQCLPICIYTDDSDPCCQLTYNMGNGTMMDKPLYGSCTKCGACKMKAFQCLCLHEACAYYDKEGCLKFPTVCKWQE